MRVGNILSGVAFTTVASFAMSACLSDLPPATQCPPDAKHAVDENCVGSFGASLSQPPGKIGCVANPAFASCFGARDSCSCGSNDCPSSPGACYPAGDCPAKVTTTVGGPASCIHLAPEAFLDGDPNCTCGCATCVSVCDGIGPVIAANIQQGQQGQAGVIIPNLQPALPASGRLGVYVRARGLGNLAVAAFGGALGNAFFAQGVNMTPADFTETVAYVTSGNTTGGPVPEWHDAAGAPTRIGLIINPGPVLAEIDCIIPFVVPLQ